MRVHSVEAIAIEIPLTKNFGGSTYAVRKRCTVITRMRTDAGLVSEVYNGDNREHGREIVRLIHEELAPRVTGLNIFEGERIWETLFALTHATRARKTLVEAIACVDCALWDLRGKARGESVSALLGGSRASLPIISIGGYYMDGKTHADIGREMEAYRQAGMAGCKFKVGGLTPEEDAKRVEVARKAAGSEFILAVDANRGWSVEDAERFAHLVEPLDLRWFEEPCHWYDDVGMMARVRRATRIPITAGQSELTHHRVRRLVEPRAVDLGNFGAADGRGAPALELARTGADLVVAELDRAGAERTAAEVKGLGRRVSVVPTDVTRRTDLAAMTERTRAEFGRIDILVNNAGIYRAAAPLDVTEAHWDAVMNVNAKAVFFACQAVLPLMIAQKRGSIVSVASMAGKIGNRNNLPYNASKAAVISITKSLALAHAKDGVRVNCVCPGFVETDMWTVVAREQGALMGLAPEEFTRQRAAQVPLGRMERPDDVANVIGFLASGKSGYMTGQALSVDGGLVMH